MKLLVIKLSRRGGAERGGNGASHRANREQGTTQRRRDRRGLIRVSSLHGVRPTNQTGAGLHRDVHLLSFLARSCDVDRKDGPCHGVGEEGVHVQRALVLSVVRDTHPMHCAGVAQRLPCSRVVVESKAWRLIGILSHAAIQ